MAELSNFEDFSFQGQSGHAYPIPREMFEKTKTDASGLQYVVPMAKIGQGSVSIMDTRLVIDEVRKLSSFVEKETMALNEQREATNSLLQQARNTSESARKFFEDIKTNFKREIKNDIVQAVNDTFTKQVTPQLNRIEDKLFERISSEVKDLKKGFSDFKSDIKGDVRVVWGLFGATIFVLILGFAAFGTSSKLMLNPMQKRFEHRRFIVPMVVSESVFVQIGL